MRYIPHTDADIAAMLRTISAPSIESLFAHIPSSLRLKKPLDIEALDEAALLTTWATSAVKTPRRSAMRSRFFGAGLIPHNVPRRGRHAAPALRVVHLIIRRISPRCRKARCKRC